jgi:hypothetical protein
VIDYHNTNEFSRSLVFFLPSSLVNDVFIAGFDVCDDHVAAPTPPKTATSDTARGM